MAQNPRQMRPAPGGMASAPLSSRLPPTRCRRLSGLLPARYGVCAPAPTARGIYYALDAVGALSGLAVYRTKESNLGQLGNPVLVLQSANGTFYTYQHYYETTSDGEPVIGIYNDLIPLTLPNDHSGAVRLRAVQYGDELFIADSAGGMTRFYIDTVLQALPGGGTGYTAYAYHYPWGLTTPASAPTLVAVDPGRAVGLTGTYSYVVTNVDELGRESSPSAAASITVTNKIIQVQHTPSGGYDPDPGYGDPAPTGQIRAWNTYRTTDAGAVYYYVTQVQPPNVTYDDSTADDTIQVNAVAPDFGQNDPPLAGTMVCVWKNRLVCNLKDYPHQIQISNAAAPTQFSIVPDPDDPDQGLTLEIGSTYGDPVMALINFGSVLGVLKRYSYYQVVGDDQNDFATRLVGHRGCAATESVATLDQGVVFLSHDGVYMLPYGGDALYQKISTDIDDQLAGFYYGEGDPVPDLVSNALTNAVGWTFRNRYYLSIGNRCWCYDPEAGGWSDAGYGHVQCATTYQLPAGGVNAGTGTLTWSPEMMLFTGGQESVQTSRTLYAAVEGIKMISGYDPAAGLDSNDYPPLPAIAPDCVLHTGPFDASGAPEDQRKRAVRLQVWGHVNDKRTPEGVIGSLSLFVDDACAETYPIDTRLPRDPGLLIDQQFMGVTNGERMEAKLEFTVPVTLGNQRLEYVALY